MAEVDYRKFGGRFRTLGTGEVLDFGWRAPFAPPKEVAAQQEVVRAMPDFRIRGGWNDDPEMVGLWDCAKVANGGKHFNTFWQQTGSCVGNGLGQAIWHLSAVEVVRLHDAEQVILPFYLLPYGMSRLHAGMHGEGEGSYGSAAAQAAKEDGILAYNEDAELPQPTMTENDGITWGSRAEMKWSNGDAIGSRWLNLSRKHLVNTVSPVTSADKVWEALSNYYPCTIASDWGGQMSPLVQSDPPCLLNKHVTAWMHQMCTIARWRHPRLGQLFYLLNSWKPTAHGICPSGAQPGGFWVTKADMDYIVRQGDSFVFSQFQGFPAQTFSWAA